MRARWHGVRAQYVYPVVSAERNDLTFGATERPGHAEGAVPSPESPRTKVCGLRQRRAAQQNTHKLLWAGGAEVIGWLAPDSKVLLPDRYVQERLKEREWEQERSDANAGPSSAKRPGSGSAGSAKFK